MLDASFFGHPTRMPEEPQPPRLEKISRLRRLFGKPLTAAATALYGAAAAALVSVIDLYPQVPALRNASTACAAVISGVV